MKQILTEVDVKGETFIVNIMYLWKIIIVLLIIKEWKI